MNMGKPCCPSGAPKPTMIRVGDVVVGLTAIGEIFKKLYEAGKKPDDVDRHELVKEVSIYNYIPSEGWNEYAEALIEEYKKYYNGRIK
jgi:hypothetical protein